MLVRWRNENACDFDACMASLNGPLRFGQISTNENVNVRSFRLLGLYLRETG
jgi:hypothetical protein